MVADNKKAPARILASRMEFSGDYVACLPKGSNQQLFTQTEYVRADLVEKLKEN